MVDKLFDDLPLLDDLPALDDFDNPLPVTKLPPVSAIVSVPGRLVAPADADEVRAWNRPIGPLKAQKRPRRLLFDEIFSQNEQTQRAAISASYTGIARSVRRMCRAAMLRSDTCIVRHICRQRDTSAWLVYVLCHLTRDRAMFEHIIENADASMWERLQIYRVALCVAVRSLYELPVTDSNAKAIVNAFNATCYLLWVAADTDVLREFVRRHTGSLPGRKKIAPESASGAAPGSGSDELERALAHITSIFEQKIEQKKLPSTDA